MQKGDFGAIWVPAFQAKDVAVALEPHVGHLTPQARTHAEPALADVVRTAWQLDAVGDTGNARRSGQGVRGLHAGRVAPALRLFETPQP